MLGRLRFLGRRATKLPSALRYYIGGRGRPRLVRVETTNGQFLVDRRDMSIGQSLRQSSGYESGWVQWATSILQPGMRVVDIGGNIGYYTVAFARAVAPTGRVLAFEPDDYNRSILVRNLELNAVSERVRLSPAAVSDRCGTAMFHVDPRFFGVHSLGASNLISTAKTRSREVPLITLDDALREHEFGPPDVVKIDAQGAEGQILRGAASVLAQDHVTIIMEVWPHGLGTLGSSVEELIATLQQAAFVPHFPGKKTLVLKAVSWDDIRRRAARCDHKWSSFNAVFIK